jgi:hypothetical protein
MKEFDLKAALNGEPVVLRSGRKAFVTCDLRRYFKNTISDKKLIGIVAMEDDPNSFSVSSRWYDSGAYHDTETNEESDYDIIGMWEEPKINIEDLPKPFKPKEDDEYFYINGGIIEYESEFWNSSDFDIKASKRGGCFRTREDAQKWLDFMKGMLE